jgi:hypothetical protein
MSIQEILDSVLLLAETILPFAGQPGAAALIGVLQPHIDGLIARLVADLSQTAAWTPELAAAFQARIDAIQTDPAWQVTP